MSGSRELPLVLITGATGYIGAHVLQQALQAGYTVRATARSGKVEALRERYEGKVDVVGVENLATGDYSDALRGVGAVIHVAAPMPGQADPAGMIDGAVEGTMNILRQAAAVGIRKAVITSSSVSALNPDRLEDMYDSSKVLSERDWNQTTREQALKEEHDDMWVYMAAKTAAEREVCADTHPEIDITTINPTFVYGPFAPGTKIQKGDIRALSTAALFYQAVLPSGGPTNTIDRVPQAPPPLTVDVRDVARAHILALSAPPSTRVGRKRLIVSGPSMSWLDAVLHLRGALPELGARLPAVAEGAEEREPLRTMRVDVSRAAGVLGLKEYVDWRQTAEDTAKSLLEVEKSWAEEDASA